MTTSITEPRDFSTPIAEARRPTSIAGLDLSALCRACLELADTTSPDAEISSHLSLLCDHIRQLVRPVDVAVVLEDAGVLDVAAASGPRPRLLQHAELDRAAGPALECHRSGNSFLNVDLLAPHKRWQRYTAFARAVGYVKVSVVPLRLAETRLGAVLLADSEPHTLTSVRIEAVRLLVASSAVALAHLRAVRSCDTTMDQLHRALRSRVVIEQAKGVVAERLHITPGEAFELLRRFARNRGLALRVVASAAIDGELGASELRPLAPRTVKGGARDRGR